MNHANQPEKALRRPIGEQYIDSEGKEQTRAMVTDFGTLPSRHIAVILNLPGFREDKELAQRMGHARAYYDAGEYRKALEYLASSLKRMPALEPYVFYYIRVCMRILAVPLTEEEEEYELQLARYRGLPKWRKWMIPRPEFLVRCKWCGRYTPYIDPNLPTFEFDTSCLSCGRTYPMPSWMWDSPDGRAYSYYRMSFSEEQFYEEFEQDYDPRPLCQHRRR